MFYSFTNIIFCVQSSASGKDNGSVCDGAIVCADLLRARGRGVATSAGQDPR